MKKLKLGIDLDDVVTETVKNIKAFHRRNVKGPDKEILAWDDLRYLSELDGNHERFSAMLNYFSQTGGFRRVPAVEGAVESLKALGAMHDIYFLTARGSRGISDTYRWMEEHGLPYDNIYFDRDKAWHTERLGIDVMVDDGIHNLDAVKDVSRDVTTIVYDRPWNRGQVSAYGHQIAANWDDVVKIIEHVSMQKAEETLSDIRRRAR